MFFNWLRDKFRGKSRANNDFELEAIRGRLVVLIEKLEIASGEEAEILRAEVTRVHRCFLVTQGLNALGHRVESEWMKEFAGHELSGGEGRI